MTPRPFDADKPVHEIPSDWIGVVGTRRNTLCMTSATGMREGMPSYVFPMTRPKRTTTAPALAEGERETAPDHRSESHKAREAIYEHGCSKGREVLITLLSADTPQTGSGDLTARVPGPTP